MPVITAFSWERVIERRLRETRIKELEALLSKEKQELEDLQEWGEWISSPKVECPNCGESHTYSFLGDSDKMCKTCGKTFKVRYRIMHKVRS